MAFHQPSHLHNRNDNKSVSFPAILRSCGGSNETISLRVTVSLWSPGSGIIGNVIRGCGHGEGSVSLKVGFEISKACVNPRVSLFLLSRDLEIELSATSLFLLPLDPNVEFLAYH